MYGPSANLPQDSAAESQQAMDILQCSATGATGMKSGCPSNETPSTSEPRAHSNRLIPNPDLHCSMTRDDSSASLATAGSTETAVSGSGPHSMPARKTIACPTVRSRVGECAGPVGGGRRHDESPRIQPTENGDDGDYKDDDDDDDDNNDVDNNRGVSVLITPRPMSLSVSSHQFEASSAHWSSSEPGGLSRLSSEEEHRRGTMVEGCGRTIDFSSLDVESDKHMTTSCTPDLEAAAKCDRQ